MSANQWPYVSRADAEKEIAHAVALERAAIIAHLQHAQAEYYEAFDANGEEREQERGIALDIAWQEIARGAHNPQTPTSGDSSALSLNGSVERSPRQSGGATGPQMAETGMDSCRPSPESEDA